MKITLPTIIIALLVMPSSRVHAEMASSLVALKISAHLRKNPPVENFPKYRVELRIDITNNTQHPIRIIQPESGAQNGERDNYIAIRRQDGKPTKFLGDKDPYINKEITYTDVYRLVTIDPGQRLSEKADPLSIYDMTQPGVYLIHVERKMPPELGGNFVSSNEITVEIPD